MYGVTNHPIHSVVDGYISHGIAASIFSTAEDGGNIFMEFSVETFSLCLIINRI